MAHVQGSADAMVQVGRRDLQPTSIPLPTLDEGSAILRMEACGLCGTDIAALNAEGSSGGSPRIMGHEIVGVVEAVGPGGRRDVRKGDRVAVDPWLPCGGCEFCLAGDPQHCRGWSFRLACYGFIPLSYDPGLWGGYSSHVYLHPKTVLYAVPDGMRALTASLWQPIASGIQWAVLTPRLSVGATIVILGSGQRGLGCVLAARAAGAALVVVTGLARDRHKLELAREFGADLALNIEEEDVVERVRGLTGRAGVDVVVDTASSSIQPVLDAVSLVRPTGTIVFAGLKEKPVDGFPLDKAIAKGVRMEAVLGISNLAYRRAFHLLAMNAGRVDAMRTHTFDYHDAIDAIDVLDGRRRGEEAINVVLTAGA